MSPETIDAFLDELNNIYKTSAEVSREFSPPKDYNEGRRLVSAQRMGTIPTAPPPQMKPPKPPTGEKIKSLVRKGGYALKNIEDVITAPQKPHRFLGTSYRSDFSGFKYS